VRCVHETSDRTEAHLLRAILEQNGIEAVVEGEDLFPLQGGAFPAGASARLRVCVLDPEREADAAAVVRHRLQALEAEAEDAEGWVCTGCGEQHGPQFGSCWRCGARR